MLPKILLTLPHILRVLDNYFLYFLFLGDCLGIFWVQAGDVYLNNTIYIYGTPNLLIDMVPHLYLYIVHSKDIPPSYRVLQNKQKQDKKRLRRKILGQMPKAAEMDHMQTRSSLRPSSMPSLPRGFCVSILSYPLIFSLLL